MTGSGRPGETQALRKEIDLARAELGETVQELAARADVPARARASYGRATARVRASYGRATARVRQIPVSWLVVAGGAGLVAVASVLLVRGRRR